MDEVDNYFSQINYHIPFDQTHDLDVKFDHSSMVVVSDSEPSFVTKKQSTDSSNTADKLQSGEQVPQNLSSVPKKRNPSLNSGQLKDGRDGRSKKQKKCHINKNDNKVEDKKPKAEKKVADEKPPTGYIHVRARRGQATDNHSLAERVRRQKISERMKILQHLVPGCDKVTGKALVLDEIITYVQSLQDQVEFLSMKLASVNPLFYDFGTDLDALIIQLEGLNVIDSPPLQMQSSGPPSSFAGVTTTVTTATISAASLATTNYPLLGQRPGDSFMQDTTGTSLWDADEQKQKFLNPIGFNNSLRSPFH